VRSEISVGRLGFTLLAATEGSSISPTEKGSGIMLVLTRKHQEKIRIGDNITITILKTKGKAVRVGIEAPANVPVVRGELAANSIPNETSSDDADVTSGETVPLARRNRWPSAQPTDAWTAKSRPHQGDSASRRGVPAEITLQRVSRANVAKALPALVGAAGPLRSMMEQRTTV
jgi:carbon storage regulator CsrA